MFATIVLDLRWAVRHAFRRPLVSAAVVGTLTLGVAATTIAHGLATSVLWRPLPFRDAERLVFVWEAAIGDGQQGVFRVTSGRFAEWRGARSFTSLALFGAAGFSIDTADGLAPVRGVRVSSAFFETIGVSPVLGRTFAASDEVAGQHQVVVLSHAFWQRRLGGRPDVIGQSIRLSGLPYTVVGVMPPVAFPGWPSNPATISIDPTHREFWVPIARTPQLDTNTRSHVFGVIARLAPGVTREQATDELQRMASPSAADAHGGVVTPVREQFVRDARLPLLTLVGGAAALLLVACANLAALQVSAFESRRRELTVRAAIGATAGRLASQLAAESLLLAAAAGAAGLVVARYALVVLPGRLPPTLPFLTTPTVDVPVAVAAALVALGSGLAIAAWPIGHLLRSGPAPRGVAGRARGHVFRVLVAAQVSLTIALVTSAALLVQSLWSVQSQDPGFVIEGVTAADVTLPAGRNTPAKILAFEDALRPAFEGRAGIRGVALAYDHPLEANWTDAFRLAGVSGTAEDDIRGQAQLRIVSPSYFDALGVDVLTGRAFNDDDGPLRPGVAVVNEAFALQHRGAVVGRQVRSAAPQLTWGTAAPSEFEILGVVENERFRGLERPSEPAVYLSTRQFAQTAFTILISAGSSRADPRAVAREVRAGVRAIEPAATVTPPASLGDLLADQLVARRVTADVIGGFAAAGLALVALGVYAVLSMLVASRTREIGVRLALGATPGGIARWMIGESILGAAPGLVGGIVLALVAGRLLEGVLVGVTGKDPLTLALVTATMLGAAVLAALVPAVRAARVDPVTALRGE